MRLHVQPRAGKTEFAGWHQDCIKVRIARPPVGGAANQELRKFLSKAFRIPMGRVFIVRGSKGRRKDILLAQIDSAAVDATLAASGLVQDR